MDTLWLKGFTLSVNLNRNLPWRQCGRVVYLEHSCCILEVPGSRPPPCHSWDLFLSCPQLVCLLPVGIFNYRCMLCLFEILILFPFLQWHACKLAKLSACIAKCMTTIDKIYIIFTSCYILKWEWKYFCTNNMLLKPPRVFLSFLVNRVSFRNFGISPAQWNNFWHILQSLMFHCYNNISKSSFQVQLRCVASAMPK